MRAFAAVFAREIAERRMVFPVGLGAGLLFLGASALIGFSKPGAADVRVMAAVCGAAVLALLFGLLYGSAVIAGETADRRISFYFSRPISALALWAGKLAAAIALTIGPGLLVVLPALLTRGGAGRSSFAPDVGAPAVFTVLLLGAILLVLGAHGAATVTRLRSPWVALDAVFAGLTATALVLAVRELVRADVLPSPGTFSSGLLHVLVLAILAALAAASLVQVAAGRTDARRAHGAFSATLWSLLLAVVLALGGFTAWVLSADARALGRVEGAVLTARRGPWLAAGGPLRGGRGNGTFLFDVSGGRSVRVRGWDVVFSPDGTRAVWGEPRFGFFERKDNRLDLFVADLDTGRAITTGIETSGWPGLALSSSGRALAVRDGRTLSAYDVSDPANPKQLAAFTLAEDMRAFAFVGEDTIRLFPRLLNAPRRADLEPPSLEITELSLPSKKLLVTGRFDREALPFLRLASDGRLFVGTRRLAEDPNGASALTLHDGRTGALLATLAAALRNPQARFLAGNRLAIAGIAGASARLLFFEGEKGWGAPTRTVDLGPAKRVVLGGEIAAGRVAVSLLPLEENPLPASRHAAKLLFVDAATGTVSPLGEGLLAADRMGWWTNPVLPPAEAGSPASSLFLDASDRLVRLDPATGAQTVLLGKGK